MIKFNTTYFILHIIGTYITHGAASILNEGLHAASPGLLEYFFSTRSSSPQDLSTRFNVENWSSCPLTTSWMSLSC